jgi:hypothetical protein
MAGLGPAIYAAPKGARQTFQAFGSLSDMPVAVRPGWLPLPPMAPLSLIAPSS